MLHEFGVFVCIFVSVLLLCFKSCKHEKIISDGSRVLLLWNVLGMYMSLMSSAMAYLGQDVTALDDLQLFCLLFNLTMKNCIEHYVWQNCCRIKAESAKFLFINKEVFRCFLRFKPIRSNTNAS